MMNFRIIKAALVELLGNEAAGRYRVAGYQKRGQAALEILNKDRIVQVYYSQGLFPKSGGGISGPTKHDMTFNIDLFVSMASSADLAALNNPASSKAQIEQAISDLKVAEDLVDDAWDEFAEDIYQIIQDARNRNFGLDVPVASRWIGQATKDSPVPRGELVTLTGTMTLTCAKDEQVKGATPVPLHVIDTEIIANEDPVGKAGVIVGVGDYYIQRGTLDSYIRRGTGDFCITRGEA